LLGGDGYVRSAEASGPFDEELSVRPAIEMMVLFEGIRDSAPQLIEASSRLLRGGA